MQSTAMGWRWRLARKWDNSCKYFQSDHQIFSLLQCCHLHEVLAAGEEPGGEPEQLPAALVAAAHRVVRQLLQDLAVDLVTQNLLRMNLPYFR